MLSPHSCYMGTIPPNLQGIVMRYVFLTALTVLLLASAAPSRAEPRDPSQSGKLRGEAEEALREGTQKIMRALELIIQSVPQYDLPKVNEYGDIIIRRRNPERPRQPSNPDEART